MILKADDLREIQLFKYYRLVRKWANKTYNLTDAELELLIYFDCIKHFTRDDFIKGTYTYAWNKRRWEKLRQDGWIEVYRHRNRTTMKFTVYKLSLKAKLMITRMYKVLLGEEDLPFSSRSVFHSQKTYTDKVMTKAIEEMRNDNTR